MPRRKETTKTKPVTKNSKQEAPTVVVRRGRPKKIVEPIQATKDEELQLEKLNEADSNVRSPEKIVLRRVTQADIERTRQGQRILWTCVSIIMVLVVIIWGVNVTNLVKVDLVSGDIVTMDEFKQQLKSKIDEVDKGIFVASSTSDIASSTDLQNASTTDYNTNLEEVKMRLEVLLKATSTEVNK